MSAARRREVLSRAFAEDGAHKLIARDELHESGRGGSGGEEGEHWRNTVILQPGADPCHSGGGEQAGTKDLAEADACGWRFRVVAAAPGECVAGSMTRQRGARAAAAAELAHSRT